jgi:aquaporin Z
MSSAMSLNLEMDPEVQRNNLTNKLIGGGSEEEEETQTPDITELLKKCAAEFMGTMFLCLTIALSVDEGMDKNNAPLAIGLSVGCMVFALGHISGANFNPAVTLAILLRGRMEIFTALAYVLAQIVGGFFAGIVGRLVIEDWCQNENTIIAGRGCISGYPASDPNVNWITAFLVEAIFTMGLALVVLNVAVSDANAGNSFYGLAIGLTVTFGAIAGGAVSGGAYNPAVGLALPLVHGITDDLLLYLLGPLTGGALAALFFRFTAKREEFVTKKKQ